MPRQNSEKNCWTNTGWYSISCRHVRWVGGWTSGRASSCTKSGLDHVGCPDWFVGTMSETLYAAVSCLMNISMYKTAAVNEIREGVI